MKTRIVAVAALFMSSFISAQVSISPVSASFAKKASDQITITNDGILPVIATLSAQTLGLTPDGHAAILPLSKEVVVKLHDISGRIEPNTSRTFDYDIKCPRCVTMVVATITPIEKRAKDVDDGEVHTGVRIRQAMATVVYVCPKERGCRDSFAALWRDAR